MPVQLTCPECDATLQVPDNLVGKTLRCRHCRETFRATAPMAKAPRDENDDPPRRSRSRDEEDDRPQSRRRDDDEDDIPRRSRRDSRDDDEDDAPRSRRRDRDDRKPKPQMMPAALVVLIKGCGALVAAIIPCTAPFGAILGGLTLIFGIIALVIAKKTQRYKTGLPIAAICVGVAAVVIGSVWTIALNRFFKKVDEGMTELREQEKKEVESGPALKVTAPELYQAFPPRRLGSNSPYFDRVVEVTGTVKIVTTEFGPTVHLDPEVDPENPGSVVCHFPEGDRAAVTALELGGRITIRGRCTGRAMNMVTLEDCRLVGGAGGKAEAIVKTAGGLADEFLLDEKAFKGRYRMKLVEVTGTVKEARPEREGGGYSVTLEGNRRVIISCVIPPGQAARAAELTVGQQVTVRGQVTLLLTGSITLGHCTIVQK